MATGGHGHEDRDSNNVGTLVPNRIFVGGISGNTNEEDLRSLFARFGNVKATKIIVDRAGISKGYGFVTFETEEEAQKILKAQEVAKEEDRVVLKERKLNIMPAVKKQPYRTIESNPINAGSVYYPTLPSTGSSGYSNRESVYYPQGTWPLVWPQQQYYLQQQCHYPAPPTGYPQYVYSFAPPDYPYQSLGHLVAGSEYSETSSADSGDTGKSSSRQNVSTTTDYDRTTRSAQPKTSPAPPTANAATTFRYGSMESLTAHPGGSPYHHLHHHHVLAKTVNGMAVMAYPSSLVMGSPTILHVKDHQQVVGDSEGGMTELEFLHSPVGPGGPTPPPTPLAPISCDFSSGVIEALRKN